MNGAVLVTLREDATTGQGSRSLGLKFGEAEFIRATNLWGAFTREGARRNDYRVPPCGACAACRQMRWVITLNPPHTHRSEVTA